MRSVGQGSVPRDGTAVIVESSGDWHWSAERFRLVVQFQDFGKLLHLIVQNIKTPFSSFMCMLSGLMALQSMVMPCHCLNMQMQVSIE